MPDLLELRSAVIVNAVHGVFHAASKVQGTVRFDEIIKTTLRAVLSKCKDLLLQSYLEIGAGVSQLAKFETVLPNAVRLARAAFEDRLISGLRQAEASAETIVNELAARLE